MTCCALSNDSLMLYKFNGKLLNKTDQESVIELVSKQWIGQFSEVHFNERRNAMQILHNVRRVQIRHFISIKFISGDNHHHHQMLRLNSKVTLSLFLLTQINIYSLNFNQKKHNYYITLISNVWMLHMYLKTDY